jgi:hypothetical protein
VGVIVKREHEIKRYHSKFNRREFYVMLSAVSLALTNGIGKAMAGSSSRFSTLTLEESLQLALRTINSDVTKVAADTLVNRSASFDALDLHLRNAKIAAADVKLIANALDRISVSELARLGSLSLSYNAIGDEGANAIANALPNSLTELGLVRCSIGDQGGEAILDWAKCANGLRIICIEDNIMSVKLRNQFGSLRDASPSISVFV